MTEATNNTSALLPCPFCGGTNLEVHGKPGILNAHDDVGCNDCDAFTPEPTWNRRAPPAAAVVMPPSPYMPGVEPESLTDYERGEAQGRCDMWAEVARLNPAPDHVEHVRAMVVPEGWLKALDEAVSAIYFDDGADFRSALLAVVRNLSPGIADELDRNETAAWHMVQDMLAAAPTPEQPAKEQGHE